MSKLEKTESGRIRRRQSSITGPIRPTAPQFRRLYSGQHLDDNSYYHHNDHHEYADGDSRSTLAAYSTNGESGEERKTESDIDEAEKVRYGSSDHLDLESRGPPLKKKSTTRSVKPENLVRTAQPRLCLKLIDHGR